MREAKSRLYQASAYFLGKTIAELPLFFVIPAVFVSICYPMIDLREGWDYYLICLGIVVLVANVATSFGYMISCASSSISMALSIAPPIVIPFLIFGGFFLNSDTVPNYFKWLSYFSWFRYGNEALMINQWNGITDIICEDKGNQTMCFHTGTEVLAKFSFNADNFYWDIFALVFLIVIMRIAAYLFLLSKARSKD